jgi:hypothetical protein
VLHFRFESAGLLKPKANRLERRLANLQFKQLGIKMQPLSNLGIMFKTPDESAA